MYVVTCVMVVEAREIVVVDSPVDPGKSVAVSPATSQNPGAGAPAVGVLVMVTVPGDSQKLGAGALLIIDGVVVDSGLGSLPS